MLEAALHKQLRDFPLDLKIQAKPGEIMVLMGENGAGKSTVLNILSGLLMPDAGSIRLNGRDLYCSTTSICVPVESRRIGYVLQNSAVFPHLSVSENIAYGMKARHMHKDRIAEQVDHWMGLMDIRNLAGIKAGKLSGGQKQRVAIARALAIEPELLMLDEPFTALDADSTATLKRHLRTYVRDLQIPCILVTHRLTDTQDIGDAACTITRGTISWQEHPCNLPESGCRNMDLMISGDNYVEIGIVK